jgi:hypothetical protein
VVALPLGDSPPTVRRMFAMIAAARTTRMAFGDRSIAIGRRPFGRPRRGAEYAQGDQRLTKLGAWTRG